MRHVTLANCLWLTMYVAMVVAIVWTLVGVRERILVDLARPEAQADWDEWVDAAKKQAGSGPVRRHAPGSTQPPALVLLRDHFPAMMTGSIVFSSLLYGTLMFVVRGVFSYSGNENSPPKLQPVVRSR